MATEKKAATHESTLDTELVLPTATERNSIYFGLEDENEERGNWTGRFDFFLSCLGYAVGLGNVWRFPYLCYKNGGGVFLIPYTIFLFLVAIPVFFLELCLGQFTSMGPLTCWNFAPLFQGVGLAMVIVSGLVAIYYNMIIAWSLYYFFASITDELPWEKCRAPWATEMCYDYIKIFENMSMCDEAELGEPGWKAYSNGSCYLNGIIKGIWDLKIASDHNIYRTLPSQEYYEGSVVGTAFSKGLEDLGTIRWKIMLCYLLAFILVIVSLSKSIKSSGKVVYFTATFPYVVLVILFIRGLFLDGYEEGIKFYITPVIDKLYDSMIWKDAAVQIFFSLSTSWGGLIALASYNRFHNDALRDTIAVSLGNCATSVFAGFVIFSYLGSLSRELGVPIDEVATSGPSLAFVVYPYAVTKLPWAPLWSILFFLMLITLGVDSQFVLVETVTTGIMDKVPMLRNYKLRFVAGICTLMFVPGLVLTTNGGPYVLELMDTYAGGWNLLLVALCECISISYVYGIRRFLMDVEVMLGENVLGCVPFRVTKIWWFVAWAVIAPTGLLFVLLFSWIQYTDITGEAFPDWADIVGWMMTMASVFSIVGGAIWSLCKAEGNYRQKIHNSINPTSVWGPYLVQHRKEVAEYVPGFNVNPWLRQTPFQNQQIEEFGKLCNSIKPTPDWGPYLDKHREEVAMYIPGFVINPQSDSFRQTPFQSQQVEEFGIEVDDELELPPPPPECELDWPPPPPEFENK